MKSTLTLCFFALGMFVVWAEPEATNDAGEVKTEAPSAFVPDPTTVPSEHAEQNEEIVPPPFPLSRYAPLWEHSPFQLESIAPPSESAGLAQKYALTGIAQVNGEPIVFLLDRATQVRHMLDKKTNSDGLSLVQVNMEKKSDDSTAVVRQAGELGVVKFDATAPAMGAIPTGIQGQVGQPGRAFSTQAQSPPQLPGAGASTSMPIVTGQPGQRIPTQMPQIPGQFPNGQVPSPTPHTGIQPSSTGIPGQAQPPVPGQTPPPARIIRRRALIPALP